MLEPEAVVRIIIEVLETDDLTRNQASRLREAFINMLLEEVDRRERAATEIRLSELRTRILAMAQEF